MLHERKAAEKPEIRMHKDADKYEWRDISSELYRVYVFPRGDEIRIDKPVGINIKRSENGDSHRVFDESGKSHYVRVGWLSIYWENKDGEPPFRF